MIADRIDYGGILDELDAAVAELRHVSRYLAWVGESDGDALSRAEHRLADSAERIGEQVADWPASLRRPSRSPPPSSRIPLKAQLG